jgi:5-methylthioadenosine/S-adenosylhomocysteine deaminase
MSILIRNVLHENAHVDVYIEGNRFKRIGTDLDIPAETIIDGTNKAILPSFFNGHTHAAMTLLRGYADDMELHTWLNDHIWPLEASLTEDDVYVGAKLACLEMIKSGTTFFNDMYWHFDSTAQAVQEMGIRSAISSVFIDFFDEDIAQKRWKDCVRLYQQSKSLNQRIQFALGPHAIYSVSKNSLLKVKDFAQEHGLCIHIHLSESQREVQDALAQFGLTPVEYLHTLGLLGPNLCCCHAIWVTEKEMDLMAQHQVKVIHNPVSNLKLCSGSFPYEEYAQRHILIGLGTDGCSSNNNLDMFEEMKFATLAAKAFSKEPTLMPATEIFKAATVNGAEIFGLDAGQIAEEKLADCILVDLCHPQLVPNHNLISNLVYAANGDCVHTTICDGKILMLNRHVPREEEIIKQAKATAKRLVTSRYRHKDTTKTT